MTNQTPWDKAIIAARTHIAVADEREKQQAIRDPIFVPVTALRALMPVIEGMAEALREIASGAISADEMQEIARRVLSRLPKGV